MANHSRINMSKRWRLFSLIVVDFAQRNKRWLSTLIDESKRAETNEVSAEDRKGTSLVLIKRSLQRSLEINRGYFQS